MAINIDNLPKGVSVGKGFNPEKVKELEAKWGIQLPDPVKAFLSDANGMKIKNEAGKITFLDFKNIFKAYAGNKGTFKADKGHDDKQAKPGKGVAQKWWSDGWIPIAKINGGDLYCIDNDPGPGGKRGQVILFRAAKADRVVVAPNFNIFLDQILTRATKKK